MSVLSRVLRSGEGKKLKAIEALVPDINSLEPEMEKLSDRTLQAKTGEFKQRLEQGEDINDLLVENFPVVYVKIETLLNSYFLNKMSILSLEKPGSDPNWTC